MLHSNERAKYELREYSGELSYHLLNHVFSQLPTDATWKRVKLDLEQAFRDCFNLEPHPNFKKGGAYKDWVKCFGLELRKRFPDRYKGKRRKGLKGQTSLFDNNNITQDH